MQFRTFTWPNEPSTLKISYQRKITSEILENGHWFVNETASTGRIFEGEGVFYGDNCHTLLQQLGALLQDGISGILTLPEWGSYKALLTELSVTEEDKDNYLSYRYRFVEVP